MGNITKNFSDYEFMCKCGCGEMRISPTVVLIWQMVRDHFGKRVTITSGCRCPKHNRNEEGEKDSQHLVKTRDLQSHAADGQVEDTDPGEVAAYIRSISPNALGVGIYNTFTHIDDRKDRAYNWDNRTK